MIVGSLIRYVSVVNAMIGIADYKWRCNMFRLWCKRCGENLAINEDMCFGEMYSEATGVFDIDLSGMMCSCEDAADWCIEFIMPKGGVTCS